MPSFKRPQKTPEQLDAMSAAIAPILAADRRKRAELAARTDLTPAQRAAEASRLLRDFTSASRQAMAKASRENTPYAVALRRLRPER